MRNSIKQADAGMFDAGRGWDGQTASENCTVKGGETTTARGRSGVITHRGRMKA